MNLCICGHSKYSHNSRGCQGCDTCREFREDQLITFNAQDSYITFDGPHPLPSATEMMELLGPFTLEMWCPAPKKTPSDTDKFEIMPVNLTVPDRVTWHIDE